MKKNIIHYSILLISIAFLASCKQMRNESESVSMICIRDSNSLLINITNTTQDTIFIPSDYTGIYNSEGDSVFLEVM
jgi:hypothetical protein